MKILLVVLLAGANVMAGAGLWYDTAYDSGCWAVGGYAQIGRYLDLCFVGIRYVL